jgi:hypothetical protein
MPVATPFQGPPQDLMRFVGHCAAPQLTAGLP